MTIDNSANRDAAAMPSAVAAAPPLACDVAFAVVADVIATVQRSTDLRQALAAVQDIVGDRLRWSLTEVWSRNACGEFIRCSYRMAPDDSAALRFVAGEVPHTPAADLEARLSGQQDLLWMDRTRPAAAQLPLFRADDALSAGFVSACAVPVAMDGELSSILTFFSVHERRADHALLKMIAAALTPLSAHIERLKVESELRDVDRRLQLVCREAGTATYEVDFDTGEMKWDDEFCRIFGFDFRQKTGTFEDVKRRIHPEDYERALAAVEASRASAGGLRIEHRIIRTDGEVRHLLVRALNIPDSTGRTRRRVGICWDETGARAIADRAELLATIHQHNPQPVFRIRGDGGFCEGNKASRALWRAWADGDETGLRQCLSPLIAAAKASGVASVRDVDIADRTYQLNTVPVAGRDYVNVYASDVTAARRAQQAMQQAGKMEAIGLLAGGIAHDFNNRLTVILGNLELLQASAACNDDMRAMLQDAQHAAESSSALARRLLAIARPRTDVEALTDINDVIRGMENLLGRSLGEARHLRIALADESPKLRVDHADIEDLLVNLVLNARDAMVPGDSVTIETRAVLLGDDKVFDKPDVAPGEYFLIAVTDTGCGMAPEIREHAIEPFFTTKADKGTGLGLSTVYSFVKQCGGSIGIYSEVGVGTCVKAYLPLPREALAALPPRRHRAAPDAIVCAGRKVLYVEDDARIRIMVTEILTNLGCDVRTVADGESALDCLLEESHLDLLITDLVLPGAVDGRALLDAARRRRPALKVMVMSGYTKSGPYGELLEQYGDCEFLGKPFTNDELIAAVRQACAATRAAASPGRGAAEFAGCRDQTQCDAEKSTHNR